MGVWTHKRGDTNPQRFQCLATNGQPKNLANSSSRKLLIKLSTGVYLARNVAVETPPGADGWVVYTPQASDWAAGSGGAGTKASPFTVGGFIPSLPLSIEGDLEHIFEIEVVEVDGTRTTFPNGGHHLFRCIDDLGDAP